MFQEVSNNRHLDDVEPLQATLTPSASQVRKGADDLMDELFNDLEGHLDDPTSVDSLVLHSTNHSHKEGTLAEFSQDLGMVHTKPSSAYSEDELLVSYTPLDSTLALKQGVEASLGLDVWAETDSERSVSVGKRVLASVACASVVGMGMFWVGRQVRLQHAPVAAAVAPIETKLPVVSSESKEFANYVTQSLERIDQETKAAKLAASQAKTVKQPSPGALPNLPNTPRVGVASPNSPAIPNNAERVYVPVAEVPVPTLKAKPVAPKEDLPVIAAAKASPAEDNLPELKPLPMTPPSDGERKFLGGTNLGDQPVFMVSINGSTRHIKLGEAIDETGATFVEFDGEQSVLKQGNQLRSVTAGQSF